MFLSLKKLNSCFFSFFKLAKTKFMFFEFFKLAKNKMNVVILGPWVNGDEIQVLFIKIYIGTSTCRTHLIRCALDRFKSQLSPEIFPDILKAFLTSLD